MKDGISENLTNCLLEHQTSLFSVSGFGLCYAPQVVKTITAHIIGRGTVGLNTKQFAQKGWMQSIHEATVVGQVFQILSKCINIRFCACKKEVHQAHKLNGN